MKTISLLFLVASKLAYSENSIQTIIPLNDDNGIPFQINNIDYIINGFDIDSKGNFYFFGGKENIVIYNGDSFIMKKHFNNISNNKLHINNDTLFIFDNKYNKNNLVTIDLNTLEILRFNESIISNTINSFEYVKNCFIAEVFDYEEEINLNTELCFIEFRLDGKITEQVKNRYGLPVYLYPENYELMGFEYMGKWKDFFVYNEYDFDKDCYKIILGNEKGETINEYLIEAKTIGEPFYENPPEHRKLRNEKLYFIGRKRLNLVVTEYKLVDIFQ